MPISSKFNAYNTNECIHTYTYTHTHTHAHTPVYWKLQQNWGLCIPLTSVSVLECVHQSSTRCQPRRWSNTSTSCGRTLFCCTSWNLLWHPASTTSRCCTIVMTRWTQTARSAQCGKHVNDTHVVWLTQVHVMMIIAVMVIVSNNNEWIAAFANKQCTLWENHTHWMKAVAITLPRVRSGPDCWASGALVWSWIFQVTHLIQMRAGETKRKIKLTEYRNFIVYE